MIKTFRRKTLGRIVGNPELIVQKNGDLSVDVLNKDARRCRGSAASLSDLASMIGQPKKKE